MPDVSVVIPTFNCARYLAQAVNSVLAQTCQDLEILVIDDGSTDDTESVMQPFGRPVRYIRQPNRGVSEARNRGLDESRGRYVAFLDADDTWYPHKLERQLAALLAHPNHGVCHSAFVVVNRDLEPLAIRRSETGGATIEGLLTRGNLVGSICTVVCERALLPASGGFDPSLSQCADWDLWVRLAARTRFHYVDEPLVTYRQHSGAMSTSVARLERDSVRVLEKGFAMPELSPGLQAYRRAALARNYMVVAGSYFRAGAYRDFLRCAARAIELDFRQAGYLLTFPARSLGRLCRREVAHGT